MESKVEVKTVLKVIGLGIAGVAAVAVLGSLPDIVRYFKISTM